MKIWIHAFCALIALSFLGADWLQFRNDGRATSEGSPPAEWSIKPGELKNIAWQVDLEGRGPSSPIVVGDQVIVTTSRGFDQNRLRVLSYDLESGKERWRRDFWATGRTATHPSIGTAAPTPASDGKRIFAFFSSNDLVCLDLEGNLQWIRGLAYDYPKAGNDIGMSSSPFVIGDTVVVQIENQGDSFAIGVDASTGVTRWRHDRSPRANWCSPVGALFGPEQRPTVFLQSPTGLTAHDATTGDQLWKYGEKCDGISSPLTANNMVYVAANGLTALRVEGSATPEVAWKSNQLAPASTSPVLYRGRIYTTNRSGVLACADAVTGKSAWDNKLRLKGRFWATHVAVNGKLYCFNSDGKAMVVALGDREGKIEFEMDFEEGIQASPAVAGDSILVRTDSKLYKIGS